MPTEATSKNCYDRAGSMRPSVFGTFARDQRGLARRTRDPCTSQPTSSAEARGPPRSARTLELANGGQKRPDTPSNALSIIEWSYLRDWALWRCCQRCDSAIQGSPPFIAKVIRDVQIKEEDADQRAASEEHKRIAENAFRITSMMAVDARFGRTHDWMLLDSLRG